MEIRPAVKREADEETDADEKSTRRHNLALDCQKNGDKNTPRR